MSPALLDPDHVGCSVWLMFGLADQGTKGLLRLSQQTTLAGK